MRLLFFLAVFLICGIVTAADVWENPSYVEAVKKYYETTDRAKLTYQNELEKEFAAAQRRGDVALFKELEKELNHTKGNAGHAVSAYAPKSQNLRNAKRQLQRNVETARSQFKRSVKNLAADLLKSGNADEAKTMDRAADAVEPTRVPGNVEERLQRAEAKEHLDAVRIAWLNLPDAELKVELSTSPGSWGGIGRFTPDSKQFVAASHNDRGMNVFDLESGKCVSKIKYPQMKGWLAIHPDGKIAVNGTDDGKIVFWNLADGSTIKEFQAHAKDRPFGGLKFSADGSLLASGSADATAAVWDVETGKELKRFAGHADRIFAIDLTPDGKTLATSGADGKAILWDVNSGRQLHCFGERPRDIAALAFNHAGTVLAADMQNNAITFFDVRSGKVLSKIVGCQGWVCGIGFSPDDSQIAVGCRDGSRSTVWDVKSRMPLYRIPSHRGWVHTAIFSPDGKTIATCAFDPVQIWKTPTPEMLEKRERELEEERKTANEILLRKMPIEVAEVGWSEPYCGPHASGRKEFENTFWAHAPSKYVFRLGRKWKTLETSYGLIRRAGLHAANCIFIVKGDGKELFRSAPIRDNLDRPLSLDVRNVDRLELIVDPNGTNNEDQACWFEPKLKR